MKDYYNKGEERPTLTTSMVSPSNKYRTLPMPARYAINALLVLVFLVIGEALISGGVVNRYQSGVLEQVGIYIIMAVSLNIATGYLGQLPLGHAGFMSVGGYSCALFIICIPAHLRHHSFPSSFSHSFLISRAVLPLISECLGNGILELPIIQISWLFPNRISLNTTPDFLASRRISLSKSRFFVISIPIELSTTLVI